MARTYEFALVDAFSNSPLGGNPCSIVFGADSLSDSEMLAIAKEMNQSETAFLFKSQTCDLKARYFTPEREIPLAGHPTIAGIFAAIESGIISAPQAEAIAVYQLELKEGPIRVEAKSSKNGNLIRMFQRKPQFSDVHESKSVLPLFGLNESDLLPGAKIQTVSTGTPQMMVPLKSHESLKRLSMDVEAYKAYRKKMNFFSPHFFCLKGIESDATTFARHLGVSPDTAEDAFTGSATGGMAAYLWHYGLIKKSNFIAEQGHWMGRPGRAYIEVIGPPNAIESVVVAGHAITVVRGELSL
jgi:trans-2,3-dihydro-3-hydroxyanthranilate isomerase